MNIKLIAATAALLACATPGFAVPVDMNFEGATSFESINNFYNGGTDSAGASGTNYHVGFGADLLAVTDDTTTQFSGQPGPGATVMVPVGSLASIFAMSGLSFAGPVSFYYSANAAFTIKAFDKFNANVGTLDLLATNTLCAVESPFCSWSQKTLNLNGKAERIDFGGGVGIAGFDNITATTVPAPAPVLLMASGLVMLARTRVRRKRAL